MPFLGEIDDRIRRREDRLGRSIVTIKGDNAGWWRELLREIEDIAHSGGAERDLRLVDPANGQNLQPQKTLSCQSLR